MGLIVAAGLAAGAAMASAQAQPAPQVQIPQSKDSQPGTKDFGSIRPISLDLQPVEPESVYAPPSPPREDEGLNEGAVHASVSVGYFTDYVFRGIELSEIPAFNANPANPAQIFKPGHEDSPQLQVEAKLSWDLGKMPHPFIGVFVNYADSDPISAFQEVRPFFGVDWTIRPVILSAGHTTYLYPNRDKLGFDTSEVWGQIQLDDSYFLASDQPFLSPYIFGAYDYDLYKGWYLEAGVSHDFMFPEIGLTLTADANVGYVRGIQLFETVPKQMNVNGFQHYQFGLIATYSLNTLFKFPTRYGDWSIQGFLYYTDGIDNKLLSTTQVWGGGGIAFKY